MNNKKYYFCYSVKLKYFLKSLGFSYEISGNNNNTNKPFWAYLRDDKLSEALIEWGKLNNYS
jgi:hypothetical protein